jgi:riboflavin kinase/FMN adenylyltransferase
MEVLHHPGNCVSRRPCAVTIGAYDGVHTGHRLVIDRVRRTAAEQGLESAVVTFDRHPATVVRPQSAPKLLTDLDQKLELLAETGVDYVLLVHFDEERSKETAEEFVQEVLVGCLDTKAVVVGHDFHFGRDRRGNVGLLQDMGAELGFDVTGLRLFSGPHQVRGTVAHGDKRGRLLGFPTANVSLPDHIALPADGVYAGWYHRPDGVRLPAAISLGRRPTFYADRGLQLLECYLLDFDGDLYGEPAQVDFVAHLRDQARFESSQALVDQMGRDVATTRRVLGQVAS